MSHIEVQKVNFLLVALHRDRDVDMKHICYLLIGKTFTEYERTRQLNLDVPVSISTRNLIQ